MFDTKEFVEFSHTYLQQEGWETAETWPSVWSYDSAHDVFVRDTVKPDPYELIDRIGELIRIEEADAMLVMTGWMTKIVDEDTDDDDAEEERFRVRLYLKAGPSMKPTLCVERPDGIFETMDGMGEGMFPTLFNDAIHD